LAPALSGAVHAPLMAFPDRNASADPPASPEVDRSTDAGSREDAPITVAAVDALEGLRAPIGPLARLTDGRRYLERPPRPLLRRASACEYLLRVWGIRQAPATLAKLACIGGGPRFRLCGRWPMYNENDLDEYARDLLGALVDTTSAQG
jgi:hypothetical protein